MLSACPDLDLCLILDTSISVDDSEMNKTVDFAIYLLRELIISQENTHVAVISFSGNASVAFGMGDLNTLAEMETAIRDRSVFRKLARNTLTDEGVRKANEICFVNKRDSARQVALVVTDGKNQGPDLVTESYTLRTAAQVVAAGVYPAPEDDLLTITGSAAKIVQVNDYTELATKAIVDTIIVKACGKFISILNIMIVMIPNMIVLINITICERGQSVSKLHHFALLLSIDLHQLQATNYYPNSRLVVDEDELKWVANKKKSF